MADKKETQENQSKKVKSEETAKVYEIGDPSGESDGNKKAPSGGPEDAESLREELEKLKSEYLYLKAEFENYKRNAIKERSEMVKYGSERIIVELLDVLDIFDRALQSQVSVDSLDSFRQGFEMTAQEFRKVLSRFGVQDLDSKGKPFDPSLHEALSSEETNEVEPGHVTQVFKEAYKLHDKIIRPGQVVVAKPKTESGSESKERVEE